MALLLNAARPARHFWLVFSAEVKRLLAYRVQFWCELVLSSAVELLVACTVWKAVFESGGSPQVAGYTYEQMVLYVTVAVFFGQAVRGTSVGTLAREIYDGSLTKYLVYPISIYSYKLGTFFPRALFALVQLGIALIILQLLGYWPAGIGISLSGILLTLVILLLASTLYFFLLFLIESAAFWADHVWALSVMLQISVVLLSGKWIPIDFFPERLQTLLALSPFPHLTYLPVKVFLGLAAPHEILAGLATLLSWCILIFFISRSVYLRGLRRYTGVGM